MAGPIKSVLLVDYGSLLRSLTAAGGKAAAAFGSHVREWLSAIESGALIEPSGQHRTLAVMRCYAEPGQIGQRSAAFAAAGFEMIDCGAADSEDRADLAIAIDAMEAASEADAAEVILLTAAGNLAHLIKRIKARGRKVVVYADEANAEAYAQAADGIVSAEDFSVFLVSATATPEKGKITVPADRGRVESFAREMNTATGIPLFSPKTFAELFRLLCDEISTNGYHFQTTAKNVAERLGGGGRTVTSRQVVFVVKGLALKGHVFSTSDTPERLAEVFREQARYLIGSAGITLDADRERLLNAWIAAPGARSAAAAAAPKDKPQKAAAPAPKPAPPPAAAAPAPKPAPPPAAAEGAKQGRRPPEKKPEPAPPPRVPERPKSAALPPKAPPPEPAPQKPTPADVRSAIAARIAASARIKPPVRPAQPPKPPPRPVEAPPQPKPDALESSILAAIAEAVDVLVEDSGKGSQPAQQRPAAETTPPRAPPPERPAQRAAPPPPPPPAQEPEPLPEPEEGSGDIGDEIQRIVASYNKKRTEDQRG